MNRSQYMDTINVYTSQQSEGDSVRENISYALNIILLLITAYSEMSGASSCNHNGIVDGLIKICKGAKKKEEKKDMGLEHNDKEDSGEECV